MRIEYDPGIPAEYRAAIEPLIERHRWVLPGWVQMLYVEFYHDDASLSTLTRVEYRKVSLRIHPPFLSQCEASRSDDVLHEFLHAPLEAMRDVVFSLLDATGADDALRKWAEEQLRVANEMAVCDLTHAIAGRLAA
jgi:hypothetical protein